MAKDAEGERCGECRGDDLEVVGIREVRRPTRRGEASAEAGRIVALRVNFRCRTCGCDGFVLRRVEDGHPS